MELISTVLGAVHGYYDDCPSSIHHILLAKCDEYQIASELMRAIPMCADMPTVMAARQCARFVDVLMDTHFWLERIERDGGTIMELKLPNTVSGWIREYKLVSRIFVEVCELLEHNNYIQMREFKRFFDRELTLKTRFELLLPNKAVENGYDEFGFIMHPLDCQPIGYTEAPTSIGFIGWDVIDALEYPFDMAQFLARLLYYCPFVRLMDKGGNPIRVRY